MIDLENVSSCLRDIKDMSFGKKDNLVIFYRERLHRNILDRFGSSFSSIFKTVRYVEIKSECKDALDFNLDLYLGYLIGSFTGSRLEIVIVSRDRGYSAVSDCMKDLEGDLPFEICIRRVATLYEKRIQYNREVPRNLVNALIIYGRDRIDYEESIVEVLKEKYPDETIKFILNAAVRCGGSKQNYHNILSRVDSSLYLNLKGMRVTTLEMSVCNE